MKALRHLPILVCILLVSGYFLYDEDIPSAKTIQFFDPIMQNQAAMQMVKENGFDVFSTSN